jgi:hypothetical protein
MPQEQRVLRIGSALYALALIASYAIPTAVGGNADRLGALCAGPLAACALGGAPLRSLRGRALVVLVAPLLYWQANAPVADFAAALGDPAVRSSYYAPLLGELRALGIGYDARPARIEVVPSVDHWEARWVAPHVMIARGWERQLDRYRNGLFYRSAPPGAAAYGAWLQRNAISYVALPDAPLDYSAHGEARLLRTGAVPGLRPIWRSRHWRLYAVRDASALSTPPSVLERLTRGSFDLRAPRAGSYTVRARFTPFWSLAGGHGCVARGPEGWTQVDARRPGTVRVVISFSLARVFSRGRRCR